MSSSFLYYALLHRLPPNVAGGVTKQDLQKWNFYNKKIALKTKNFIRFNTQKYASILLFDVDNFPDYGYKPPIEEFASEIEFKTGIKPNFIVDTSKGYHIGILHKGVFLSTQKGNETIIAKKIRAIKQEITKLIGADVNGSHRISGIWRNPLTHKHKLFTKYIYDIDDIFDTLELKLEQFNIKRNKNLFISKSLKVSSNSKIQKTLDLGFFEGNRNNYIFSYAYKIKFEQRNITDSELLRKCIEENYRYKKPLKEKEVINNVKSVIKFSQKMYQGPSLIVKNRRGKLSNEMWQKGIHGIKNRRIYAAKYTSNLKIKQSKMKIKNAIEHGITQIYELKSYLKMDIRTIKKYFKEILLRVLIEKKKIDIRPKCTYFFEYENLCDLKSIFNMNYSKEYIFIQCGIEKIPK